MKTRPFFLLLATAALVLLSCSLPGSLGSRTPTARPPTRPAGQLPTLPPAATQVAPTMAPPTQAPPALPSPTRTRTSAPTLTTPPQRTPTQLVPLQVEAKLIKDESKPPAWIMQIRYPSFTANPTSGGAPARAVENLNLQVAGWINRQIKAFAELVKTCTPPPGVQMGPNSLYVEYQVTYNDRGWVSIYFTPSTYCQGAAHPYPWSETLTYNLASDKVVQLADLFKPGANYLAVLSQRSIAELKNNDAFQAEEGAKPEADNFKSWNITPAGLRITFDPYQVAAYTAGYLQVTLPWDSLKDILNPAFP